MNREIISSRAREQMRNTLPLTSDIAAESPRAVDSLALKVINERGFKS
jgi:hypothetical protein